MTGTPVTTLHLDGEYGLARAAALAQQLQEAVVAGATVRIDTAALAAIHVTTLQLLVAAFKTAGRLHASLAIAMPPGGALATAMARCGLTDIESDGEMWIGLTSTPAARSAA